VFFKSSQTFFNSYCFLSPAFGVVGDSVECSVVSSIVVDPSVGGGKVDTSVVVGNSVEVVVVSSIVVSVVNVNVEVVVVIVETVVCSRVVDCVTVLLVVVGDASIQRMLSRATASTTSVPQYA
jgi:hypothetical protein